MNIINSKDIRKIISIVKESKKFITQNSIYTITEKSEHDYVTKVDTDIEDFIKNKLRKMYPYYRFMGEEKGFYNIDPTIPTWVLDPIDGTTNLIHNFNHSAISLGLVYENASLIGIVYNPFTDELFYAEKGKGSYLNGVRINVSNTLELSDALVSVGTSPYSKTEDSIIKRTEIFKKVLSECCDIRRTGSAVLDICYVAAGKIDSYFEETLRPWDYAAATCILEEAGGKITTYANDILTYSRDTNILATNGKLHLVMNKIIN